MTSTDECLTIYDIPCADVKSQTFCWGGSSVASTVGLYLAMGLVFPVLFVLLGYFVPFIRRAIAFKLDSDEVAQILQIVKGTSFFYIVISFPDLVNYVCEIPPVQIGQLNLQAYLNAGPADTCQHLSCWGLDNIISLNNFTGLIAQTYYELCQICGQTGGQAKDYFIALLFGEAFFGFIIFTLVDDLKRAIGRIMIASICWLNGLMWLVSVEFFRCREFSILPTIDKNRCEITDVTVPGRVFAMLYSFIGFLMLFIILLGEEVDCDTCKRKYWLFLEAEHKEKVDNVTRERGVHTALRRLSMTMKNAMELVNFNK